jgi:hypothetical protein
MATLRTLLDAFVLAAKLYANASVTVWQADEDGIRTSVKATLYAAQTGADTLANPQKLDGDGKLQQPVYFDTAIIVTVDGLSVGTHETGVFRPTVDDTSLATAEALAAQTVALAQEADDASSAASEAAEAAAASAAAAALASAQSLALVDQALADSGALLQANNLSDLADVPSARDNLGIGQEILSGARLYLHNRFI